MTTKLATGLLRLCLSLLCSAVGAVVAEATTVNLTPVADTFINSGAPNNNAAKPAGSTQAQTASTECAAVCCVSI